MYVYMYVYKSALYVRIYVCIQRCVIYKGVLYVCIYVCIHALEPYMLCVCVHALEPYMYVSMHYSLVYMYVPVHSKVPREGGWI